MARRRGWWPMIDNDSHSHSRPPPSRRAGSSGNPDIAQWLFAFLSEKGKTVEKSGDIFESGLIDSMGLIEMVTAIEDRFKIELSSTHLQDSRFRTIEGISQIIGEELRLCHPEGAGLQPEATGGVARRISDEIPRPTPHTRSLPQRRLGGSE